MFSQNKLLSSLNNFNAGFKKLNIKLDDIIKTIAYLMEDFKILEEKFRIKLKF